MSSCLTVENVLKLIPFSPNVLLQALQDKDIGYEELDFIQKYQHIYSSLGSKGKAVYDEYMEKIKIVIEEMGPIPTQNLVLESSTDPHSLNEFSDLVETCDYWGFGKNTIPDDYLPWCANLISKINTWTELNEFFETHCIVNKNIQAIFIILCAMQNIKFSCPSLMTKEQVDKLRENYSIFINHVQKSKYMDSYIKQYIQEQKPTIVFDYISIVFDVLCVFDWINRYDRSHKQIFETKIYLFEQAVHLSSTKYINAFVKCSIANGDYIVRYIWRAICDEDNDDIYNMVMKIVDGSDYKLNFWDCCDDVDDRVDVDKENTHQEVSLNGYGVPVHDDDDDEEEEDDDEEEDEDYEDDDDDDEEDYDDEDYEDDEDDDDNDSTNTESTYSMKYSPVANVQYAKYKPAFVFENKPLTAKSKKIALQIYNELPTDSLKYDFLRELAEKRFLSIIQSIHSNSNDDEKELIVSNVMQIVRDYCDDIEENLSDSEYEFSNTIREIESINKSELINNCIEEIFNEMNETSAPDDHKILITMYFGIDNYIEYHHSTVQKYASSLLVYSLSCGNEYCTNYLIETIESGKDFFSVNFNEEHCKILASKLQAVNEWLIDKIRLLMDKGIFTKEYVYDILTHDNYGHEYLPLMFANKWYFNNIITANKALAEFNFDMFCCVVSRDFTRVHLEEFPEEHRSTINDYYWQIA